MCMVFIHVSDIGADPEHASRRMRSKAAGDAAVLEALPGLATVKLRALFPLIDRRAPSPWRPTTCATSPRRVVAALSSEGSKGKTYYLGGPRIREIMLYKPVDALKMKLPPMPRRNYMATADYVDEISTGKLVPPGVLTYSDLDMIPAKITEGTAMEPIRYSRVGGYAHGDTRKLAQKLPPGVKRYYGIAREMDHEFDAK
ncbi:MAG: hypothetical protein J3K34DRAFT_470264 [Monoraphidium minutum]|nr:MAG: hypothetical protein J3K34DRAFT_470264 [Monoraphidium minutum]